MTIYNYWLYNDDVHCAPCAELTYGDYLYDPDARDKDGDPFRPVFQIEEHEFAGYPCGTCRKVVA